MADRVRITLIEALPSVLPMFSRQLISYTESTFKENKIDLLTRTMVKEVTEKSVVVQDPNGKRVEIPFGLLVWAGVRFLSRDSSHPTYTSLNRATPSVRSPRA
jgi:NADH:ubiquinone reductase (non-electrogenic)